MLQWNIPQLYQEIVAGLREIGAYEEAVESVSCTSWAGDYLLFNSEGALIAPAFHHADPRMHEGRQKVLKRVPLETIYQETGVQHAQGSTLFQFGAEKPRRLSQVAHLLPVADAFNYLLAGVRGLKCRWPAARSSAIRSPEPGPTTARRAGLAAGLLPPLVPSGTPLGRSARRLPENHPAGLRVVSSCSHEAARLCRAARRSGETWAFLRFGSWASWAQKSPSRSSTRRAGN